MELVAAAGGVCLAAGEDSLHRRGVADPPLHDHPFNFILSRRHVERRLAVIVLTSLGWFLNFFHKDK